MNLVGAGMAGAIALAVGALAPSPVLPVSIELKDVAADRIERQRKAAQGALPLAGTPDLSNLPGRLAGIGAKLGDAAFIRVFKAESELEIWLLREGRFVHFATYPICYWSGSLGPKMREGDKQTPEGFYTMSRRQLHRVGRWPRSLNLGYPNAFDRAQSRNGSYILVHGGCTSVGCFAMTNPVMREVYDVAEAALREGQLHVPVHVFPFRMTAENLVQHRESPWHDFWLNLKEGHDAFDATRVPPKVSVCENRYRFEQTLTAGRASPGPLGVCGEKIAAIEVLDRLYKTAALRPSSLRAAGVKAFQALRTRLANLKSRIRDAIIERWADAGADADDAKFAAIQPINASLLASMRQASNASLADEQSAPVRRRARRPSGRSANVACSMSRASCRKFVAMRRNVAQKTAQRASKRRVRTASGGKSRVR